MTFAELADGVKGKMKSQLSDKDKSGSTQVQRKILEVKDLRTYFLIKESSKRLMELLYT